MSFAEQVGAAALVRGVQVSTRPCWRCEGHGELVHRDINAHGNLEERTESCPECKGIGKIVPHWSNPFVQQFVCGAIMGAMDDCRNRESYDLAWEVLDWGMAYLSRCLRQATEELNAEYGEEKGSEMLTNLFRQASGKPQEEIGPLEGALSPEELEELVG